MKERCTLLTTLEEARIDFSALAKSYESQSDSENIFKQGGPASRWPKRLGRTACQSISLSSRGRATAGVLLLRESDRIYWLRSGFKIPATRGSTQMTTFTAEYRQQLSSRVLERAAAGQAG
jgi:hypothetical protein